VGADSMVTLSSPPGEQEILAHPLGTLRVSQKEVPLGLTMEKFGEAPIEGDKRFDLGSVTIRDANIDEEPKPIPKEALIPTQEFLGRGTYVYLNEEERLEKPSFELFDVGVTFGTADFLIPEDEIVTDDLSYETYYLFPGGRADLVGDTRPAPIKPSSVPFNQVRMFAKAGAAAGSEVRQKDRLRNQMSDKVLISQPELSLAATGTFQEQAGLDGLAKTNRLLAEQQIGELDAGSIVIVESFELDNN
jgi:hypothetical protein